MPDPVLRRNPRLRGDRSGARGVQVSKAGARLVHDVGGEYVRIRRHHLRRLRGLDALLECAAIGYALKRSRNELRIVGVAEPTKNLVLVIRVEVFARIKLIGVLKQGRAGLVNAHGAGPHSPRIKISIFTALDRRGWPEACSGRSRQQG